MITYPKELPYPLRDGYGFSPVSAVKRTTMQTGRARVRRNYASVPTEAKVQWMLDSVQAEYFESWVEDALLSGSQWFECELRTPQGLLPYKAQFKDGYEGPVLFGVNNWTISATLVLWERPILRGGWAIYAPQFLLNAGMLDVAINRNWPE
ncbi:MULTISPECIES: hypothetical protein [Pseudomonas]|uniref:Transposase n=1 Tax=Pseudomonas rustica TaxID=2827099 RepID=A0ABS5N4Z4_9PSED|nr:MULTISPECIES: hypothetical protein [Pseudomonas]MBS4081357.1 hypothetical protein [Pseudomonas rustica]